MFGKALRISCRLDIKGPGRVVIGDFCRLTADPWGNDYVTLYTHRKNARIFIGSHTTIRAARFGSHLCIRVGERALIECASIYDSDFHNVDATRRDEDFNENDRQVVIGNDAYVGIECLCSKGTRIGDGAILLPSSVIGTKTLPDMSVSLGLPARIVARG